MRMAMHMNIDMQRPHAAHEFDQWTLTVDMPGWQLTLEEFGLNYPHHDTRNVLRVTQALPTGEARQAVLHPARQDPRDYTIDGQVPYDPSTISKGIVFDAIAYPRERHMRVTGVHTRDDRRSLRRARAGVCRQVRTVFFDFPVPTRVTWYLPGPVPTRHIARAATLLGAAWLDGGQWFSALCKWRGDGCWAVAAAQTQTGLEPQCTIADQLTRTVEKFSKCLCVGVVELEHGYSNARYRG